MGYQELWIIKISYATKYWGANEASRPGMFYSQFTWHFKTYLHYTLLGMYTHVLLRSALVAFTTRKIDRSTRYISR